MWSAYIVALTLSLFFYRYRLFLVESVGDRELPARSVANGGRGQAGGQPGHTEVAADLVEDGGVGGASGGVLTRNPFATLRRGS